jgi:hypothetical protein
VEHATTTSMNCETGDVPMGGTVERRPDGWDAPLSQLAQRDAVDAMVLCLAQNEARTLTRR